MGENHDKGNPIFDSQKKTLDAVYISVTVLNIGITGNLIIKPRNVSPLFADYEFIRSILKQAKRMELDIMKNLKSSQVVIPAKRF